MSATGVLTTVGIVVAASEGATLKAKRSLSMRPVIGGFVLGLFLFPLDEARPDIAKAFMVLIVVSALLLNGTALLGLIANAPNTSKK